MQLIRLILATWRLSYMVQSERAPFGVMEHVRRTVAPNVEDNKPPETEIEKALDCFYCTSIWIALIIIILDRICPVLVDVLALSAGAIAVDRWNSS